MREVLRMNFLVRNGKFDVAVVSGPNVDLFPTAGVKALSTLCAEMGLTVGLLGGDVMRVFGVIPLAGTGGIVLLQDSQQRVHRVQARAIVRVSNEGSMPDPFPGWRSQGLVPLSTATKLVR